MVICQNVLCLYSIGVAVTLYYAIKTGEMEILHRSFCTYIAQAIKCRVMVQTFHTFVQRLFSSRQYPHPFIIVKMRAGL